MATESAQVFDATKILRHWRRLLTAGIGALVLLALALAGAHDAAAATVSGAVKGGQGYQVVLVQSNGLAREVTITRASGAFKLTTRKLPRATLHLVAADGSYFGPIVLKSTRTSDYCAAKGTANLRLGALSLMSGYALAARAPLGRYDTRAPYIVTAKRGKPIGAGKVGRVKTGTPMGYNGEGGDLDRDGVVGAFDIDDNGNLILDNTDRTGRGQTRPLAQVAARAGMPPGPEPAPEFRVFSNFRLPGGAGNQDARVNANIPGIQDVEGLIDTYLSQALTLIMTVMGDASDGSTATLDGLGNAWVPEHQVDGVTFPKIELDNRQPLTPAGHGRGPNLLDLVAGTNRRGDAFIFPGATADQIGSGDAFVETAADGTQYAGVLNFAFNTVPAIKSFSFDGGPATTMNYDSLGVPDNHSVLPVPPGAKTVTLTCWRPQRKAALSEVGSVTGDWVDIGKLEWEAPPLGTGFGPTGEQLPGTSDVRGAYVSAFSNSAAGSTEIAIGQPPEPIILDPAGDMPADSANTISITLSFERMYSDWGSFAPGSTVEIDLGARGAFGDLASSRVLFKLQ